MPKQSLIRRIAGLPAPPPDEERGTTGIFPFSWEALAQQLTFAFNGVSYPYGYGASTTYAAKQEPPEGTFEGYVNFAYRTNGVVFACMVARMLLFSEARFQFRRLRNGRPGDLFGNESLAILEKPWPNGTTGDLLARAMQDSDLAGNFYARRGRRSTLKRMRPDWVDIILGSDFMPDDPAFADDVEVAGYAYWPGGRGRAEKPVLMLPEEVCHFAPIPDPCAHFRGMSWLTPVVREIMADSAATDHKQTYFENGATPNLLVKGDPNATPTSFQEFVDIFKHEHGDLASAFRFMFLGGGADATVIGNDMKQMDFKVTQGAGETRICMAARVPPIIVGSAEGLESATYSNYGMARRAFADLTMRPLWRQVAGSLAQVVDVPDDAELWYDDRDIPFLQEDVKDAADIVASQAQAIRTLTDGGYTAESVVPAVVANDLRLLEHSGMLPVQVRPPGEGTANDNANGSPSQPQPENAQPRSMVPFGERYDPNQPRDPGGEGGGQWVAKGGAGEIPEDDGTEKLVEKHQQAWRDGLSEKERSVINIYSQTGYMDFNAVARGDEKLPSTSDNWYGTDIQKARADEAVLREAINRAELPEGAVLYRKARLSGANPELYQAVQQAEDAVRAKGQGNYTVGEVDAASRGALTEWLNAEMPPGAEVNLARGGAYASTSARAVEAANFASPVDSKMVLFRVSKPRRGAYIEPLAKLGGESEILVPPDVRYRVTGISEQKIRSHKDLIGQVNNKTRTLAPVVVVDLEELP